MSRSTNQLNSFSAAFIQYQQAQQEVHDRVMFAAETIRNTTRKLTVPIPTQFRWAVKDIQLVDFRVMKQTEYGYALDQSAEVCKGEVPITEETMVFFTVKHFASKPHQVSLPVKYLTKDPVAIAQWVRSTARAEAPKERENYIAAMKNHLDEAQKKLDSAQFSFQHASNKPDVKARTDRKLRADRRQARKEALTESA